MSFGIPAALLFGLVLILASLSLFLTSKFKPDLHQESDNIYAIVGIICGLLLLVSLDLGAAMAFQQLLMIGALISIMWQFLQVRAENKRLKGGGRSAGREVPARRAGYTARIDDEPEYAPAERSNRRNKDRFDRRNNEREYPEELPSRRSATRELPEDRFAQTSPRRLSEPARAEVGYLARRQNESWDEEDWNDSDEPARVRRALPDADYASSNRRSSSGDTPKNRSRNTKKSQQKQPPRSGGTDARMGRSPARYGHDRRAST
ncbi:Ycf66 family protein [Chamaesiphon polymorphus]|uniref:Ycf66 family protein n=1 Tax=Chamaesiphon polymorphus TaxID=2107691 RepID=UPI0015E74483|nr:Ycf66 family protein [Chamaesiphon polymorphus]